MAYEFQTEKTLYSHEHFIRQTLKLAKKAEGKTLTNPMVGAVLVCTRNNQRDIIGQGFHKGYGKPHAEIEAIEDAKRNGYSDLSRCTLYVNLEPCCHFGKTPPCTDRILSEKIPHVIFGTLDPFKKVAGKGKKKLLENGVQVEFGFLEDECRELNKVFFKHVKTGLPWVTLKMAQSVDGKIATANGDSKWISSEASRKLVHRWRSQFDAVLVGAETVMKDNPSLNVRLIRGRHPKRIILDGRLRLPDRATVVHDALRSQTIILTSESAPLKKIKLFRERGVKVYTFKADGYRINIRKALKKILYEEKIASVLVEGGAVVHGEFLKEKLADEIAVFIAPKLIGNGRPSVSAELAESIKRSVTLNGVTYSKSGDDLLLHARL